MQKYLIRILSILVLIGMGSNAQALIWSVDEPITVMLVGLCLLSLAGLGRRSFKR